MAGKNCRKCIYYRYLGDTARTPKVCHYSHDTGQPRECPADDNCNKFKKKNNKKKALKIKM